MLTAHLLSKHPPLDKDRDPRSFASTLTADTVAIQSKCVIGLEEAKKGNSPLVLEKEVDSKGQQQTLDKELLNRHLLQTLPLLVKRTNKYLHV